MQKYIILILTNLLILSCSSKHDDKIIASVYEKDLTYSEIIDAIPNEVEDSVYFAEKFINDWIRKELMLSYAEININTDLLKYKKQIEDYRSSLLIFAYKQELLNQNLDTFIAFSDIENYYERYKDEFKLNKNIFKGRIIIVDKSAPNLSSLDKWYKSEGEKSMIKLEDYCQQFAKEYFFGDNKWQYFSVYNYKLPELIKEEEYFLKNTKGVFFEDDIYRYYIYIKDYKISGDISPLSFESNKIKDLLLNKKKIVFLKKLEDNLYQKALLDKKIKIY